MVLPSQNNNPIQSCRYNERLVLHLLRVSPHASKAVLARTSGLTAAAIGGIIASLSKKGLVMEAGKRQGDLGQPATLLKLCPDGAFGIGVSINRGSIETILMNFEGKKVAGYSHDIILPEPEAVLKLLLADIKKLLKTAAKNKQDKIAGIGIAQPYHLGSWRTGNVDWIPWDTYDLASNLSKKTGMTCLKGNDGTAAAGAELVYGLGNTEQDFIYFYFGPPLVKSLGGGVVIDGKCRIGSTGNAGDIGLIPVAKSKLASCKPDKQYGTLLTDRASINSLVLYLQHQGCKITSNAEFEDAVENNKKYVQQWLEDCLNALEQAVSSIQSVLDIPLIVINGDNENSNLIDSIINMLNSRLTQVSNESRPMPEIKRGSFGSDAAAIGAATMPLDSYFSPNQSTAK